MLTDKSFKYTPAVATDIRKTFAKARKKLDEVRATLAKQEAENKAAQAKLEREWLV